MELVVNASPHIQQAHLPFVGLAFSGGGTRAAAFAYGVLLELDRWRSGPESLLDAVGLVSSVSGGSWTAASFAAHGRAGFESFEAQLLRRNLAWPVLWNALEREDTNLLTGRGDALAHALAARGLGTTTVQDALTGGAGPPAVLNATDVASGRRFPFTRYNLDLIGIDPSAVALSRAAAASSAFPGAFNPLTWSNCAPSRPQPEWVRVGLEHGPGRDLRKFAAAQEWARYHEREAWPYVHLVDGGLSDNTGVRSLCDLLSPVLGTDESFAHVFPRKRAPPHRQIFLLAVNSKADSDDDAALKLAGPSALGVLIRAASSSMDLRTQDSMSLIDELLEAYAQPDRPWTWEMEGRVRHWHLRHKVSGFGAYIDFAQEQDPGLRSKLQAVPTRLWLSDENVTLCVEAGGRVLMCNPNFARFCEVAGFERQPE